ncbi:MAG: phosphatase PAP2 family protein [Bordetella sp.]|nr:phosphatase PAP2 family protein [Bordetella sp.]
MIRRPALATAVAAALLLGACAGTPAALRPEAARAASAPSGYLEAAAIETLAAALPPPPAPGSAVDQADKARSTRMAALENTDRWLLAAAHAELRPPLALQHFNCPLGLRLEPQETPSLTRLMQRLFHDADSAAEAVKARAFRPRPVGDDPGRQACQRLTEAGRRSASYPSGSATVAVVYGEAFAALDPSRAAEVRRMAHEIGRSRLVCAMHYPSDVAAGEDLGRAVFAAAAERTAFAADLAAARAELRALRGRGATAPGCASEALALATPLP